MLDKNLITASVQNMQELSLLAVFPNVGTLWFLQGSCISPGDLHFPQGAVSVGSKALGSLWESSHPPPFALELALELVPLGDRWHEGNNPPVSSTIAHDTTLVCFLLFCAASLTDKVRDS